MSNKASARLGFWSAIAFALILAVLHFLEPELNVGGHLISEYELGRYGWLMTLAFFSLGAASLFLSHSIRDDLRGLAGATGSWWLLGISLAYFGAGIFYPDDSTGGLGLPLNAADFKRGTIAPTLGATLHGLSGVTVIGSSPVVFTLLRRGLAQNPKWRSSMPGINRATAAAWTGLLLFPLSMVLYTRAQQPSGFDFRIIVSVLNRIMILTYAAWLANCARHKMKIAGKELEANH